MRNTITLAFLLAGAAASHAATFLLNPAVLSGLPDSTVGWGFTIQSTPIVDGTNTMTPWMLITFADFVPDPGSNPVGVFTAFITQLPNSNTVIGPDSGNGEINAWSQSFDPVLITGIGSYHINDFQSFGDQVTGAIEVLYDLYRVSPNDPSFNPDSDLIATNQSLNAAASITIVSPEPGTLGLLAAAFLCISSGRWRRPSR